MSRLTRSSSKLVRIRSKKLVSPILTPNHPLEAGVEDRQQKIKDFDQEAIMNLTAVLVGAGGLGTEIGEGLVRKGIGQLKILDPDQVALSNLNRQKFYERDLYKDKAISLARNLRGEGAMGTVLVPHNLSVQEAVQKGIDLSADLFICAVDNNPARRYVSRYCLENKLPAIFTGVSLQADQGYVMVQEPGDACWGCALPDAAVDDQEPCPGSPAVKDILKVMGGLISFTVDSLVMDKPRAWNYREVYLSDGEFDWSGRVEKRKDCPICKGGISDV